MLIENKIDKKQVDYFIKLVQNYNNKSDINTQQVRYDELYLYEKCNLDKLTYMDFNCRLTTFLIFKDYIKSESKFTGDYNSVIFDIDIMDNNPISEFTKNIEINLLTYMQVSYYK